MPSSSSSHQARALLLLLSGMIAASAFLLPSSGSTSRAATSMVSRRPSQAPAGAGAGQGRARGLVVAQQSQVRKSLESVGRLVLGKGGRMIVQPRFSRLPPALQLLLTPQLARYIQEGMHGTGSRFLSITQLKGDELMPRIVQVAGAWALFDCVPFG